MKRSEKGLESVKRIGTLFAALLFILFQLNVSAQTGGVRPDFTASSLSGPAPLTVDFRAVPIGGASYSWNFNTIVDTPGETASFTFEEPGEFAVTLRVQRGDRLRTATKVVTVTGGEPVMFQRPYTVDKGKVGESVRISAFSYGEVYTDSATTVPVANPKKKFINFYNMVDATGFTSAMDVVIPGVKEDVHFNARNSVLAVGLYSIDTYGVPNDVQAGFYENFPAHPDFGTLVEEVQAGGKYNDIDFVERLRNMALEVAEKYLRENNLLPTGTP